MNDQQTKDLKRAFQLLESPSFCAKLADVVGTPIEKAIALLPNKAQESVSKAAHKAVTLALKFATQTMARHGTGDANAAPESSDWWHKGAVVATGGIGGYFGALGLLVEVPVTTTIMMRSIADIARSENADLSDIEIQLECVKVLAIGGRSSSDDASDAGYFFAREALARATTGALSHIVKKGLDKESAPALVRLIVAVAERYSINLTEKSAAQCVPVIGAVGGAIINAVFIDHFQDMARGHFTILRLEKVLGATFVKAKYEELKSTAG